MMNNRGVVPIILIVVLGVAAFAALSYVIENGRFPVAQIEHNEHHPIR